MKKIFLSLLFIAFSITMNAQEAIDREILRNNPNEISQFVDQDLAILKNNFREITEKQEKALNEIYYNKYKMLTSNISNEDLEFLIDSTKERTKVILGNDLYVKVSENQPVFYRITGMVYLLK